MLKLALLMALAAGTAMAQTLPSADVDTVQSGIGEEKLAPIVVKQPVVASVTTAIPAGSTGNAAAATMPAAVVSSTAGLAVSETAPIDPFTVKNVVVTLSDTTGFDRDAALEKGARQAMPTVLVGMGMDTQTAAKSVKSLGSAMNFVKGFKVIKESLIPTYVLTADLTFNEGMLRKNFGGKIPAKPAAMAVSATAVNEETVAVVATGAVEGAPNTPLKQWIVRVADRDPAAVEKVRTNLNAQASTKATYRLLTSAGAEMVVDTPMTAMEINRVAGHEVMVSEMEVALPTSTVAVPGIVSGSWQGGTSGTMPDGGTVISPADTGAAEGAY